MLTYLVRPRGLYLEPEGAVIEFPADVRLEFQFEPGGGFGEDVPPIRTVPRGAKVRSHWNACRGETKVQTDARLPRLRTALEGADGRLEFDGSRMLVTTRLHSREELQRVLETYFYGLPPILALEMLDCPTIAEVRGQVGGVSFCWGLLDSGTVSIDAATESIQQERVRRAIARLETLDERNGLTNRRLLAGVQYFHIACRLARAAERRFEFLSESLLNFAKILEALFPAPPNQTIDKTRQELKGLGFEELEIEALYIPALALRNAVDVAHPTLAAYSDADLATLQRYADFAEEAFRKLLNRVFDCIDKGELNLKPPSDKATPSDTRRIIERIGDNLRQYQRISGTGEAV
jgi:hypothetical protein